MADIYKLVTFGTEEGTGSSVSLLDSTKHQNAILRAFQAGAEDAVKFSSDLKEINSATLEWKNKILIKLSDFKSAMATAQAKAGEIFGKSGTQINPALNVEDVVVLKYEKELRGFELKQTKEKVKQMLGSFEQTGEHKYKYTIPVPLSVYEQMIKDNEDLNTLPDFISKNIKLPLFQKDGGDGGNGGDEEDNANGDKEAKTKSLVKATSIIALLTGILDVIRRILTAVLERGSEIKRVSENALQYGTNYSTYRGFEIQEKSMGLPEGTFSGALGSIQNAFGNIADLNEKALEKLTPVVGSQLKDIVLMGMGASNPMGIMELILDSYFKRGLSGYNSLGKYVGEVEAQRELTSALEKAGFSELARTLNNMFYANNFGIYKGQIGSETPFKDYLSIPTGIPSGLTAIEYAHLAELGQVIDNISAKFDQLGKQLKDKFLLELEGVLNWINDLEIGMSATERLDKKLKTKELAGKRAEEMRSSLSAIESLPAISAFLEEFDIKNIEDFLANPKDKKYEKALDYLDDNMTGEKNNLVAPLLLASQLYKSISTVNKQPEKYNVSEMSDTSLVIKSLQDVTPLFKLIKDFPTVNKTFRVLAKDALGLSFNEKLSDADLYNAIRNSKEYKNLQGKENLTKEEEYLLDYMNSFALSKTFWGRNVLTQKSPDIQTYMTYTTEKENKNLTDTITALLSLTSNKEKVFSSLNFDKDKEYASSVIFRTGEKTDNVVHLDITIQDRNTGETRKQTIDLIGTETETSLPIDLTSSFVNSIN